MPRESSIVYIFDIEGKINDILQKHGHKFSVCAIREKRGWCWEYYQDGQYTGGSCRGMDLDNAVMWGKNYLADLE